MNIFIAGGGRVGFHLAQLLASDKQNVTVIDVDPEQREQIDYALDVSSVVGDASSAMLLQQIGVAEADLFVASMGDDATNLIAAATAKGLGAKTVVARVDNPTYIESGVLYESILGVDYILSPEALAANEIANYIEYPGRLAAKDFGRGLIKMRQIRVTKSPMEEGKTLADVLPPGGGVLLAVVERRGESFIPRGDTVIEAGDHVTFVGHHEKLEAVQKRFQGKDAKPRRVVIMGGNPLGLRLAQLLENKIKSVKIFERREDRAAVLATKLTKAKVVCRDASVRSSLEQEHIEAVDIFVAATSDDERNIMSCVLAKEVGAKAVVSIVHHPDFASLVHRLDIDLAITPRACVSNAILRLVHQDQVTSLAVLAEGRIEVVEAEIGKDSPLLNRPLKDPKNRFPREALIAAVLRGEEVIVPSGDDMLQEGDSIVLIASAEILENALKVLQ